MTISTSSHSKGAVYEDGQILIEFFLSDDENAKPLHYRD
jgi:hypothetical protein